MDTKYRLQVNEEFDFSISENEIQELDIQQKSNNILHLIHQKESVNAEIISTDFINRTYSVQINSNLYTVKIGTPLDELIDAMGLSLGNAVAVNDIKAPMPGLILDVPVKAGDEVKEGDFLLVLEAMKMENALTAPRDGVVKAVAVVKGDTVDKGQLLIEME
ncbi:MAG: biotin/lipoyl-binding protein [Flavobacteriaceae bacterium]|nr:biotin/lipoyl-binding protein [Flavobacteriaceae bacterium]